MVNFPLSMISSMDPCPSISWITIVLDPKKGVCADPVGRDAILGVEGPEPPVGVSERQLDPNRGGGKT
jgi:hypothetical protein